MNEETHKLVRFIGGPWDGNQTHIHKHRDYIDVFILEDTPLLARTEQAAHDVKEKVFRYECGMQQRFYNQNGEMLHFGIEKGRTMFEVLRDATITLGDG